MKKKIFSTVLALVGISFVGFAVLLFLGVFNEQQSGILVESDPGATVYINDTEVGKTPYETNRESGEILLRIKPDLIDGVALDDYETKIDLVPGIRTIVKRVFRETEESSSGVVVSFDKLGGIESLVTVVSVPDNAQVSIGGKVYGYTPLRVKIPAGDHTLVVSSDKYLEKSLPIRVYAGYKLTASVKLAKSDKPKEPEQLAVLGETTETPNLGRIKINKTDTGFLRVRSGANTGFPEIAQVKPDEEYDILEEGENASWYKIKIVSTTNEGATNEIQGWVNAEFVTKLQ
jgi:hypothetical protein